MPFILAASAAGALPQIALTQSQTWVPPQDGNICIHVIGAGGGGGGSHTTVAISGAAGGYSRKNSLAVTTGGSYTVVIGTGGLAHTTRGVTGATGGNSTFAGTGLSATLTATGGAGGTHSGASTNSFSTAGTGSNGDVNRTGGRGAWGGGGAVGIYGTGEDGQGDVNGGHGRGGNCDSQGWADLTGFGTIIGGKASRSIYTSTNSTTAAKPQTHVETAGPLCGGGSVYVASSGDSSHCKGGDGGIGGGGGSYMNVSYSAGQPGDGGDGIVLIQYLP